MISALQDDEIDVGIGLTEGWVAGLGKRRSASGGKKEEAGEGEAAGYKIVGTYVETPLCWAISTGGSGAQQGEGIKDVEGLKGARMGVSRVGRYVCLFIKSLFIYVSPVRGAGEGRAAGSFLLRGDDVTVGRM